MCWNYGDCVFRFDRVSVCNGIRWRRISKERSRKYESELGKEMFAVKMKKKGKKNRRKIFT